MTQWPSVKLFLTSHARDFMKEREIVLKEIVPELRIWCEEKKLSLQFTDVRWGKDSTDELVGVLKDVEESYFNNVMPIFINISCESLGIIPLWGDAPDTAVNEYQEKLKMTTFEMDMLYCAHRPDNINSMFLVREDHFMNELLPEEQSFFTALDLISPVSKQYGDALMLRYSGERVFQYSYTNAGWDWEADRIKVQLSENFTSEVIKMVRRCISRDFPSVVDAPMLDVYDQIKESHCTFMKSRSAKVKGRDDIIQRIENYIVHGDKDVPLLVLGGAGSGKTSIMAKVADRVQFKIENKLIPSIDGQPLRVFYHFVGAVPGSTELQLMLNRLLRDLGVITDATMPRDVDATAQLSCSSLCNAQTEPVVIIVDAANQFDDETAAKVTSWVPRKLAPQVRCVISMINDSIHHQIVRDRESKAQEIHLMPLEVHSRKEIVLDMFSENAFKIGETQISALLAKRSSENPLWLSIACEQLKDMQYPTQRQLDACIEHFPNGLLNLLETVLCGFEEDKEGHLVVATLCLLEVSATGLLQTELVKLLGMEDLVPPSPFDEKDEKESSEKESKNRKSNRENRSLGKEKWNYVLRKLRPFLRPYGDSGEGRLDFYHPILSKAVRRKYLKDMEENEVHEETEDLYHFWHQKLADFFEHCDNLQRKIEEYLHHLAKVADREKLSECLCDWKILDKLYHDEYSAQLLKYWRQAGGIEEMVQAYQKLLNELESQEQRSERQIALRYENIARIFLQAGKYPESLDLCKVALKWEEKELGNRDDRMVELYSLMAEIYDEKLKLNDFVSQTQLPDLRKTISYGRKSIELRRSLLGDYHKAKLGLSLMKLAFSLESWEACGGDQELSGQEALKEGNDHIDAALKFFQELKDMGHYAEALMTKGVLAPRGTMEQLKYYNQAMEICKQVFGEYSLLTSRLYINIGIVHEDNTDYVKAFEYFQKWGRVSDVVLGPDHPKTLRAKGVLKEPRYKLVAQRLKEGRSQNNDDSNIDSNIDGAQINQEVERLLDIDQSENNEDENILQAAEQFDNAQMDLNQMNEELQQAINELLRRALGELDNRADLLQNILNNVNLPQSNVIAGVLANAVEDREENEENNPPDPLGSNDSNRENRDENNDGNL